jgi:flagellar basal-body rod modification protein FlgD
MSTVTNNTQPNTAGTGSKTQDASSALNGTLSDFLKLLTVQLQNQDPTEPADTNDITQQIASLSQVEQQINTNSNLERLISMFSSNQVSNAVSYIGKQIDAPGNQSVLAGGGAIFVYDLPSEAASVKVAIKDSTGKTIYSGDASNKSGRNEILWDGTMTAGGKAADGVYSFTVTAKDATGKDITAKTYTTGLVSSVDTVDGIASLSLGLGLSVPLSDVISVRAISAVVPEEPPAEGEDDTADTGDSTDETAAS